MSRPTSEVPEVTAPEHIQSRLMPFLARLGVAFAPNDSPRQVCDTIKSALDAQWDKATVRLALDYAFRDVEQPKIVEQRASAFNKYRPRSQDTMFLVMTNAEEYVCVFCWLAAPESRRRKLLFFDPSGKYSGGQYTNDYKSDQEVTMVCDTVWSNGADAAYCHCVVFILAVWFDLLSCRSVPRNLDALRTDDRRVTNTFNNDLCPILQVYMFDPKIEQVDRDLKYAQPMVGLPTRKTYAATEFYSPDNIEFKRQPRQTGGDLAELLQPYPNQFLFEYLTEVPNNDVYDIQPKTTTPHLLQADLDAAGDKVAWITENLNNMWYLASGKQVFELQARRYPIFRKLWAWQLFTSVIQTQKAKGYAPADLTERPGRNVGDLPDPYVKVMTVESESYIEYINLDDSATYYIFGDLHGGLPAFLRILYRLKFAGVLQDAGVSDKTTLKLAERNVLIFTGDLMDRGGYSWEVMLLVLQLVKDNPNRVFLVRGNHEEARFTPGFNWDWELDPKLVKDVWNDDHVLEEAQQALDDAEESLRLAAGDAARIAALTPARDAAMAVRDAAQLEKVEKENDYLALQRQVRAAVGNDDMLPPEAQETIPSGKNLDKEGTIMDDRQILYKKSTEVFRHFPSALVLQNSRHRLFLCHGGFDDTISLDRTAASKVTQISAAQGKAIRWRDFKTSAALYGSDDADRPTLPEDRVLAWLQNNGITAVVRGHQDQRNFSVWLKPLDKTVGVDCNNNGLFSIHKQVCLNTLKARLGEAVEVNSAAEPTPYTAAFNISLCPRDLDVFLPIFTQSSAHVQLQEQWKGTSEFTADCFCTLNFQPRISSHIKPAFKGFANSPTYCTLAG